jgi:predicted DNA-binding WGR domain protein
MPDDLRSPIKHHLVLHRIDPEQGVRRFYSLMIERDLFGRVVLVRNWGRIGTNGRELVEEFAGELEAGLAREALAQAKRGGAIVTFEPQVGKSMISSEIAWQRKSEGP